MISERVHRTIAVILGAVLMVGFGILDGHHVVDIFTGKLWV
jgi:Na+/H+ antiporter NhaD/arsenite permease-like protein